MSAYYEKIEIGLRCLTANEMTDVDKWVSDRLKDRDLSGGSLQEHPTELPEIFSQIRKAPQSLT